MLGCWGWMLSQVINPTTARALGPLGEWIQREIKYVTDYNDIVNEFKGKARDLEAVKIDVQIKVDNISPNERIKQVVQSWLDEATQIEKHRKELEKIIPSNQDRRNTEDLNWCFRLKWSKFAADKTQTINTLFENERKFGNNVSEPAGAADLGDIATPDYVPVKSAIDALKAIKKLIEEGEKDIIGVCGPGGVGKSKLMEQLMKQVDKIAPFDKVKFDKVHVTVAESSDLRRIQDEIAAGLKFKLEGDTDLQRKANLSKALRRKKVLIILDDVRNDLHLEASGIPYGEGNKEGNKGCKIVVTSRSQDVCDTMCDETITLTELDEEDRVKLFKKLARIDDSAEFEQAAKVVVKACGGLPNAIAIVARALSNKPVAEWKSILEQTSRTNKNIEIVEIPKEEFLGITLGYNQLQIVAKGCLQFCCLFPLYRGVSKDDFVIYSLVDKLFPEDDSLEEVWSKMLLVVEELKTRKLLSDRAGEGTYRIHDNTRVAVKYYASKEGNNLTAEAGLKKGWPEEDLKNCKKMSLMDSNITKLPDQPMCPELLTLFLQNNAIEGIPDNFFEHMRKINFLDLSHTNISLLQGSIECLTKLRALRAENTHLEQIFLENKFKELMVLIFRGSSIRKLPKGLGKWTNLKLLDLSNNIFLQGLPHNVISKLSQLEELYIGSSFGDWEIEETTNQDNAAFSEVASLSHLTVLYIHIRDTQVLSKQFDGPWKNLKRFRICVNDDYWDIASTRSMHLKNTSTPIADWVKLLLEKADNITLTRSRNLEDIGAMEVEGLTELISMHLRACSIQRIFHSSFYPGVKNVKELSVEYCYSMNEVFCLEEKEIQDEQAGLTELRELILEGLPKLFTIWKGNHSKVHPEKLEIMKVKECGKLKSIFSKNLAQRLDKLEQLAIVQCDNMEAIVLNDEAKVKPEAANSVNISEDPQAIFFQNLQKLIISNCKKMKSVLSLTTLQGLKQLRELSVSSCTEMEVIITISDEERKEEKGNILYKLELLALEDLPKLETICSDDLSDLEWASLERLEVWKCPNVKTLPMGAGTVPKLTALRAETEWLEALDLGEYFKGKLRILAKKWADTVELEG